MNKQKPYIKPQSLAVAIDCLGGSLLTASPGNGDVSRNSITGQNASLFTFEGKENDSYWEDE